MRAPRHTVGLIIALILSSLFTVRAFEPLAEDLAAIIAPAYRDQDVPRMMELINEFARQHEALAAIELHDATMGRRMLAAVREGTGLRYLIRTAPELEPHAWPIISEAHVLVANRPAARLILHFHNILQLTPEELDYIKAHPVLRVPNIDWPPFAFRLDGQDTGYAIELMRQICRLTGWRMQVDYGQTWNDYLERTRTGHHDIILPVARTPERETFLDFTTPVVRLTDTVIVHADRVGTFKRIEDLRGRRVSFIRNSYQESTLRRKHPEIILDPRDSSEDVLRAVVNQEVDAAIEGDKVFEFIAAQKRISQLVRAFDLKGEGFSLDMAIGVKKDNKLLRAILQKALAHLEKHDLDALSAQWFEAVPSLVTPRIFLIPEEEEYLARRGPVRIAVNHLGTPYTLFTNRVPSGIFGDLLTLLQKRLPLEIEILPTRSWTETLEMMAQRDCDAVIFLNSTAARQQHLHFTPALFTEPEVIVTDADVAFLKGYESLHGQRVGVVAGKRSAEIIANEHPAIEPVEFPDLQRALTALKRGKIYAVVGYLRAVSTLLETGEFDTLRIAGDTLIPSSYRIGVRSDDPVLLSILGKAVSSIPREDIDAVISRWANVHYEVKVDYTMAWQALVIFAVVLGLFAAWNRQLRKYNRRLAAAMREAEAASRAKTEFITNMSHEIRTPMNAIIAFSDQLAGTIADARQRQQAGVIAQSARSLYQMMNDVLDLSRIDTRNLAIQIAPFSLSSMFADLQNTFMPRAAAKGLGLVIQVAPDVPALLALDAVRLRQVLANLISNAIKFTDTGHVKVEALARHFNLDHGVCDIIIRVTDTGCGVPEDFKPRLFGAFEIPVGQDHALYGGTGLGLAIARRVALLMNGDLDMIDNPDGPGSVFTLHLRHVTVVKRSAAAESASADAAPGRSAVPAPSRREDWRRTFSGSHLARHIPLDVLLQLEEARKTLRVNQARDAGERIVALGQELADERITRFGRELVDAADGFDIDKMKVLLACLLDSRKD